jgi:protocatechuate 3,4-dioxygenase beta subunit
VSKRVKGSPSRKHPSSNQALRFARFHLPVLVCAAIVALSCAMGAAVRAQDQGPELRTVHGTVIDKAENPVSSAIVYLKNMKTQTVKTYITREDGLYRFSGLDPNDDYQVYAEHNDMVSSTREVSSYDSRRDIDFQLKLSHKKTSH